MLALVERALLLQVDVGHFAPRQEGGGVWRDDLVVLRLDDGVADAAHGLGARVEVRQERRTRRLFFAGLTQPEEAVGAGEEAAEREQAVHRRAVIGRRQADE